MPGKDKMVAFKDPIKNERQFSKAVNDIKSKPVVKKDPAGDIVTNHVAAAETVIRIIQLIPMDEWIKRVMIMRIGNPLINQKPMSHIQLLSQQSELHPGLIFSRALPQL